MKKERMIKITDVQTYEGTGEQDRVEITARGVFNGGADNYSLSYDEYFAEDMKSHTVLTVKDGTCVSVLRTGDVVTELQLELGKRHICLYSTPYGEMNIGIYAKEIESSITQKGGTLKLHYTIDYNGVLSSTKQMLIEVS